MAVRATVCPVQKGNTDGFTVTTGIGNTFTTAVAVFIQPLISVPDTVYVVVTTGEAVGFETLFALNPLFGPHK